MDIDIGELQLSQDGAIVKGVARGIARISEWGERQKGK